MGEANAPFEKSGAVSRDVFLAAASAYDVGDFKGLAKVLRCNSQLFAV